MLKLHTSVSFAEKTIGKIVGIYQERPEDPIQYLIGFIKDGEKKEVWYRDDEFSVSSEGGNDE